MKAFLELTDWEGIGFNCNHVYWMDDAKDKAYAYARWGNPDDTKTFTKPMNIDIRGRRFVEVRHDIYNFKDPTKMPAGRTWTVQGSRGDQYTVTEEAGKFTCTCSGFRFRGDCRHINEIK